MVVGQAKKAVEGLAPFLLHLLIIASVFDIYFKSPILSLPEPEPPKFSAPARRLVLFVADGLRAQSFYQPGAAPFLHQTGLEKGCVGVSHTQVPTESRPGHVAMLAGLYEDPSAITRGWSENPVEFDSVLNRSTRAWAWGSPDILPMFAKGSAGERVKTLSYGSELEDFGRKDSSHLDTWVFDKVETFFEDALEDRDLQIELRHQGNLFFLHLLGCDTNGHTNKPASQEYINNIAVVDKGIQRLVSIIESYYRKDGRTAYIFTADHGMTDWGSHGTGMAEETMTPFVAWGAGIINKGSKNAHMDVVEFLKTNDRVDFKQADLAPLMSTLLGRNIPVNSVGLLPHQLLDMHPLDIAQALKAQYEQLLQQYLELRRQHENVYLPLIYHQECPHFPASAEQSCTASIAILISQNRFNQSAQKSLACIQTVYQGITYYQRYQKNILRVLISLTILLSLAAHFFAVLRLSSSSSLNHFVGCSREGKKPSCLSSYEAVIFLVLFVSWFCQRLPISFILYYLSPIYSIRRLKSEAYLLYSRATWSSDLAALAGKVGLSLVLWCETLVLAFFDRRWLSLGLAMLTLTMANRGGLLISAVMLIVLGVFSWLPPIDGRSEVTLLVLAASLLYSIAAFILLGEGTDSRLKWLLAGFNLAAGLCVHISANTDGLPIFIQVLTWLIFLCSPPLAVKFSSTPKARVICFMLGLGASYTLLSLSYESLFLFSLSMAMLAWTQAETREMDQKVSLEPRGNERKKMRDKSQDVICVTRFFFLVFYSFFGTGNIASLNSFDPSSIRCFVSVFNPFLMGGLLLFKILVPILTTAIFFAHIAELRNMSGELVSSLLHLFKDFLSLHFFHLVRDSGSWLDIGTSLSHFIIVEGTGVFLLVLLSLARFLISYKTSQKISFD